MPETLDISQTNAPKPEGTESIPTPEGDEPETGRQEDGPDYAEKFKASAREAQRLVEDNRRLQEQAADIRAKATALENEKKELEELARGNNPEGYDNARLRKHIEALGSDLATLKESQELDSFVASHPEAENYRSTLKDLGRTYTGKSYRDIWETTLKSVAEASDSARTERRNSAPDMGKGNPTGEPNRETICGMPVDKFNRLSLEQRKELFKKNNIHYVMPS